MKRHDLNTLKGVKGLIAMVRAQISIYTSQIANSIYCREWLYMTPERGYTARGYKPTAQQYRENGPLCLLTHVLTHDQLIREELAAELEKRRQPVPPHLQPGLAKSADYLLFVPRNQVEQAKELYVRIAARYWQAATKPEWFHRRH